MRIKVLVIIVLGNLVTSQANTLQRKRGSLRLCPEEGTSSLYGVFNSKVDKVINCETDMLDLGPFSIDDTHFLSIKYITLCLKWR